MSQFSHVAPLGDDHKARLTILCHSKGVEVGEVLALYDGARRALVAALDRDESKGPRSIAHLTGIFSNLIEAGNASALFNLNWERGVSQEGFSDRLAAAAAFSELLIDSRISDHERSLREETIIPLVQDSIDKALVPTPESKAEIDIFFKNGPAFFRRLVRFEETHTTDRLGFPMNALEIRFAYRLPEMTSCGLQLLLEANMPAKVVMKITESLALMSRAEKRDAAMDSYRSMVKHRESVASVGEVRIAEPLGRPSLVGAIKHHVGDHKHFTLGNRSTEHELPITLPTSRHVWEYFGQRVAHLASIKDPGVRDDRLHRYLVSFPEFLAAQLFFEREEVYFRQLNLENKPSPEYKVFYKESYGVDSGPGIEGSLPAVTAISETARAFRHIAATRYGINVRKGYARPLESGKWLLEHMAEDLGAESQRFKVADIHMYPGPGVRISGLRVQNALDFSTEHSRRAYLKAAPWLSASLRCGHEVEYLMMRGFIAITRSVNSTIRPISKEWLEKGSLEISKADTHMKTIWRVSKVLEKEPTRRIVKRRYEDSLVVDTKRFWKEPYAAIWFNDHFHNDRLPEVRMWLVPERVLHRKMIFAIENGVDPNKLDVTPEGMAEEAAALGLPIMNVGTSSVRWGGFSNAWPHGSGSAHEWERHSDWSYTRWQDPHHVHRALVGDQYYDHLTVPVARILARSKVEHDSIAKVVNFFQDLHSSFLTMEESWAKGYVESGEAPARLEAPPSKQSPTQSSRQEEESSGGADEDALVEFSALTKPRTKMLLYFLEMRNRLAQSKSVVEFKDFPTLELQYTRLLSRQAGTPFISGADMILYLPDGKTIPMLRGASAAGRVHREVVTMDERMEAVWDQYFVSVFAPNNCPRILLP
jgi:hypothetical protein